jgi:hypothetical protein
MRRVYKPWKLVDLIEAALNSQIVLLLAGLKHWWCWRIYERVVVKGVVEMIDFRALYLLERVWRRIMGEDWSGLHLIIVRSQGADSRNQILLSFNRSAGSFSQSELYVLSKLSVAAFYLLSQLHWLVRRLRHKGQLMIVLRVSFLTFRVQRILQRKLILQLVPSL